ncbi:MAG: hypothetical protein J6X60_02915 [Ruminiclostridium sp.]|nr:hypothetical protein [Ruminiclostridium sp.]
MLINLSNHPCNKWSDKQMNAACKLYNTVKDYPFPAVSAALSREEIYRLAYETVEKVVEHRPDAVLCQGEFSLTYALVNTLKEKGITVICACSERVAKEFVGKDGKTQKTIVFDFAGFREY